MVSSRSLARTALGIGVLGLTCAGLATPASAGGGHDGRDQFHALEPGQFVTHELDLPIRVVLIGFDDYDVSKEHIRSWLPTESTPLVRYPQFYGLNGRELGLEYQFEYRIVKAGRRFSNRFFRHLAEIGREGPRTVYQSAYNLQAKALVQVDEQILYVDAPTVEAWLEERDTGRNDSRYTIYFINWYGRDDFRFHVYSKAGDPDPDTGFPFGQLNSTQMVAWGGTSGRSWFYDFSAGPEWNTTNWVVDVEDLDGDGEADQRFPPIWEYSFLGYRSPDLLGSDMGLLSRFVALNLLFTPSPLYDPLVTSPGVFGKKIAHVTMLEDNPDPVEKGVKYFDPGFARSKLQSFQPYYRWRVGLSDVDPIDDGAKRTLDIFTGNLLEDDCWNAYGDPFAQMFCYFDANRDTYVPRYGRRDYVAPVFSFNTTDAGLGFQFGLLGFADDNWADGTQSYVFTFGSPSYRLSGYGFTATTVHEVGHHIGLSHPHDGYDPEYDIDYGPGGFFYFAWVGDESDTVMHYLSLSNGFGEHNQDNMYRWEAAGHLNQANILAGDILAHRHSWKVGALLRLADLKAARAIDDLEHWDYLGSVQNARLAFSLVSKAADTLGVSSARLAAARVPLPDRRIRKQGCRPRPLEN